MTNHAPRCEEIRRKIQARLDGQLTAADSKELDLHLNSCLSCSSWLRRIEAENQALTDFLGSAPDTAPDLVKIEASVRQRIAEKAASARAEITAGLIRLLLVAVGIAGAVGVLSLGGLDGTAIVRDFLRDLRIEGSFPAFIAPITLAIVFTFTSVLGVSYALTALSEKEFSNAQ